MVGHGPDHPLKTLSDWPMTRPPRRNLNATAFCRSHPRLVPMNTQSGILCDPASLVLYGRCQASSRPHARSRKGESRRTLSEPFSPFESKLCIIHTCKEYRGAQLRSARCCSSRSVQKEDRKCNLRNLKSRSRLSKWSSAGASLESAVSSSNPLIVIRCANGIRSILDSLTKAMGPAQDQPQPPDSKRIQQRGLRPHIISDRNQRKIRSVNQPRLRIHRARPRRPEIM